MNQWLHKIWKNITFKAITNLFSCVKKGIIFLHENNHQTIPYEKNYKARIHCEAFPLEHFMKYIVSGAFQEIFFALVSKFHCVCFSSIKNINK